MDIQNKRIPDDEFARLRQEVLTQWPTGKDVDLQVDYHKKMPESRIFSKKLVAAKNARKTLVQPRAGVPVIEEHIKLMQYLEKEGEADLLPTTIDSYTRQNRYEEAENGIKESIRLGRAMLNGFPAVNHGVAGCRRFPLPRRFRRTGCGPGAPDPLRPGNRGSGDRSGSLRPKDPPGDRRSRFPRYPSVPAAPGWHGG